MAAEAVWTYCEASVLAFALRNALHRSGRRPAVDVAGIAVAALAATVIRGGLGEDQFAALLRSALAAPRQALLSPQPHPAEPKPKRRGSERQELHLTGG
jgi:hypothetical protein